MSDAVVLELRRLAAMVEAQNDCIGDLQRQLLAKDDRRTVLRLIPALARIVGEGRPFSVAELAALVLNDRSPGAGVIRDALADHVDIDGGFRSFGRLLQRLSGVPLSGVRVLRAPGDRWRVEGVSHRNNGRRVTRRAPVGRLEP